MNASVDPWTTPAGTPHGGETSELNLGPWGPLRGWTIGIMTITSAVTLVAVAVRILTKVHIMQQVNKEDYVLVLALLASLTFNLVSSITGVCNGTHIWNTPLALVADWAYWGNILVILWFPAIIFAKWAILLQLERIFAVIRPSAIWWCIHFMIWTSTLAYLALMLIETFQCMPRAKIWNPSIPGTCLDGDAVFLISSAFNIGLDLGILTIPTWGIWTLQADSKKKVIAAAMFSVNCLALFTAIARATHSGILGHSNDATYNLVPQAWMGAMEVAFVILGTCFPTMPRFYQWCRGQDKSRPAGAPWKGSPVVPSREKVGKPVGLWDLAVGDTWDDKAWTETEVGSEAASPTTPGTLEGGSGLFGMDCEKKEVGSVRIVEINGDDAV